MHYSICAQGKELTSQTAGAFIHSGNYVAISPIFPNLQGLLDWMSLNHWELDSTHCIWGCRKMKIELQSNAA